MTKRIVAIFGTRPEAIKMASVIMELKKRKAAGSNLEPIVCVTAQHRQMLDQVLNLFEIVPDYDLDLMTPNQTLFELNNRILSGVSKVLTEVKPDLVLVHGDTTTTFVASLAAYYLHLNVGHVEAGLRTDDKYRPFPEEMNRKLTSSIADIHFAPTGRARDNLLRENISSEKILVTGNTVIDALLYSVERLNKHPLRFSRCGEQYEILDRLIGTKKIVLITGHRRENFGQGFENICSAISELAELWPEIEFVYPVHLNPNVYEPVHRILDQKLNIHLLPPLDYEPFVALMNGSYLVLTDSGGIQEEAPSLGKPVIVMREVTERPEAVEAGTVKLVGTDKDKIIREVGSLLDEPLLYNKMSFCHNPYGDGHAAERIVDFIQRRYVGC